MYRPVLARPRAQTVVVLSLILLAAGGCSHSHGKKKQQQLCIGEAPTGRILASDASGVPDGGVPFADTCAVYLSGGPEDGDGAPGLPPGDYYFQVTDPAGTELLSLEGPLNGLITVSADDASGVFGAYVGSHEATEGEPGTGLRVQLCPFAFDSGSGGAYRAWLTPTGCYAEGDGTFGFREERSLVYDFAVADGSVSLGALSMQRFCDTDADGSPEGEQMLEGVRFMVSISSIDDGEPFEVLTTAGDTVEARMESIPTPATYFVSELVPHTGVADTYWYGTTPGFGSSTASPGAASYSGVLDGEGTTTLLFGAACVRRSTDGSTGSAFLNSTGQALLAAHDPQWRQLLNAASLVRADGGEFEVSAGSFHAAINDLIGFLDGPVGDNEAHLLSREVATSLLALSYASLDANALRVLRPARAACLGSNTARAADLVDSAQALIRADGFTPTGDPNADQQHCLRVALAGINTNAAPTLTGHCCGVVYQ